MACIKHKVPPNAVGFISAIFLAQFLNASNQASHGIRKKKWKARLCVALPCLATTGKVLLPPPPPPSQRMTSSELFSSKVPGRIFGFIPLLPVPARHEEKARWKFV